jgi:hypothetical protein
MVERNVADVLRAAFTDAPGEVLAVHPSAEAIEELVNVMTELDDVPAVRLLAPEGVLKDVMGDFILASTAADRIDDGVLSLRVAEEPPTNSLLITEDELVAVVDAGDRVAGLVTDDEAFVGSANGRYDELWAGVKGFSLRTPPISRVRTTLSEDLGSGIESDFTGVLASLETARGDDDGLDEVTISLLVAAKNEALLYDISKWGEDVGIASKATFSRTKTKLEDMGLLDTEKVPIDVGRPRLRLMLGDERLQGADTDQLASVAQTILT